MKIHVPGPIRDTDPQHLKLCQHKPPRADHPLIWHPQTLRSGGFFGDLAARLGLTSAQELPPPPAEDFHLQSYLGQVRNQLSLEACTGFAFAKNVQMYFGLRQGKPLGVELAPMFPWALCRKAEGTFPQNTGCAVADEFSGGVSYGVCIETDFPETMDASAWPTPVAFSDAATRRIPGCLMVDAGSPDHMKRVINAAGGTGQPMEIAIPLYNTFFNTGTDGMVPDPNPGVDGFAGYHAVTVWGYDATGLWLLNSWGTSWGKQGMGHISWAYAAEAVELNTVQPPTAQ